MQVSLETLSGLDRKLTISLPENDIVVEVGDRLKKLAPKVQIQGFRPGKVPLKEVTKRYSARVREEVVRDLMQKSLQEAIESKELKLAGYPKININSGFNEGDFVFEAVVQVYPEFDIKELKECELEIVEGMLHDDDLTNMLDELRKQHRTWLAVDRKSKDGDQVEIDFKGFIDDVPFEGGEANKFKFVLGEKKMIPDFEKGILGHKAGESFSIDVTFPEDYGQQELAGKKARFDITLHQVEAGELPELNDEFSEKLGIKGGVEGLKKDIQQNMQRELKRKVSQINRKAIFDKFLEHNPVDLPSDMIDMEIKNLQHELYHKIFGQEHRPNEKIPDFPRELFLDEANRRVHLSLLYSEYVKKHDIKVAEDKLHAFLDDLVAAYEDSQEAKQWYLSDKNRMSELESLLMEEAVAEKLLESAKANLKKLNFRETMEFANSKTSGDDE
jgi:trigger factor